MDEPLHVLAFDGASVDDLLIARSGAVFLATITHALAPIYAHVQVHLRIAPLQIDPHHWRVRCDICRFDENRWVRTTLTLCADRKSIMCEQIPRELLALMRPWPKNSFDEALAQLPKREKVLVR